jgi:dethiobiotin synthase
MQSHHKNAIAIAGIHTGIGKTIVSAVIAEALGADYWKPIQAGLEERDRDTVAGLLTNGGQRVHPEAVALRLPASPHAAAAAEGVVIDYTTFAWPQTKAPLVVETAGGILSPVSDTQTMADMLAFWHIPIVLVSQNYLGSINHTVAAIEVMRARNLPITALVMSGDDNSASEKFIEEYTGLKIAARVPRLAVADNTSITHCANEIHGLAKLLKANYLPGTVI